MIYLKLGQYDAEIADYTTALELFPDTAKALYGRGIARRRDVDITGGDVDIAAALAINSSIAAKFARSGVTEN